MTPLPGDSHKHVCTASKEIAVDWVDLSFSSHTTKRKKTLLHDIS